jgi:hypothetical protein
MVKIARIILTALAAIVLDLWRHWRERRDLERTRDEQQANDARDRGSTRDIIERMRDRAHREPPDRL